MNAAIAENATPKKRIPMDWRIVRFDDAPYYDKDFLAKHKIEHIFTYYIVDFNRYVHICEITASFELWKVGFESVCSDEATDAEREEAWEEVLDAENDGEDVIYMHASEIEERAKKTDSVRSCNGPASIAPDDIDHQFADLDPEEAEYRTAVEQLRDHYAGNCPSF